MFKGELTVYRDVLENKQVGRMFKLNFVHRSYWYVFTSKYYIYNGFLQMETQHEVVNELFAKG